MYGLAQAKSSVFISLKSLLSADVSVLVSASSFVSVASGAGLAVISVSSVGSVSGAAIAGAETDNARTVANAIFKSLLFIVFSLSYIIYIVC